MKNLIKADFFKMSKSFGYWVMMACSVGLGLLFALLGITGQNQFSGYQMLSLQVSYVMFHAIITSAFTAVFLGSEFSDRTIGMSLFCSLPRRSVFLSKLVVYFVGLLCLLSAIVVVPTVVTTIVNGFGLELTVENCIGVLAHVLFFWLICAALGGYFVFLMLATRNQVATIGIGLGISFVLLVLTTNYVNAGWEAYSLSKYSFIYQMFVLYDWEHLQKGLFLGVSLVTLLVTLIASVWMFEKAELK